MPFTPFHMGPALVAKAVLGRNFSIPVYAFTQVAIDAEVLAGFAFRGDLSFHKVMHTIAGGTAAAVLAMAALRPVIRPGARWWNRITGAGPGSIWYIATGLAFRCGLVSILRRVGPCSAGRAGAFAHGAVGPVGARQLAGRIAFTPANDALVRWVGGDWRWPDIGAFVCVAGRRQGRVAPQATKTGIHRRDCQVAALLAITKWVWVWLGR